MLYKKVLLYTGKESPTQVFSCEFLFRTPVFSLFFVNTLNLMLTLKTMSKIYNKKTNWKNSSAEK